MDEKFKNIGLTFDDILLVPQESDILPKNVNLNTRLTKNINLRIPIVSADMDTVTEHRLAIALALEGGIGIIHKNLSPDDQASEVKKVKRFENGFINDPMALSPEDYISKAYEIKNSLGYKNIPITADGKSGGVLVGMLTRYDYSQNHLNLKVKERMTPYEELFTVEEGLTLDEANNALIGNKLGRLLIINNKNEHRLVSLVTKTDLEKNEMFPSACKDSNKRLRVGAAVGPSKDLEERLEKLISAHVDVIAVSTAHGHSRGVVDVVRMIKEKYDIEVIAGNVVTKEGVRELVAAGADCVKVGVGPGSICTTRIVAGVGVPQVTAICDCVLEARKTNTPIIADGGIRYSGDIAKALACGAESIMLGSLLAGVDESPGEIVYLEGKTYKSYRGMGSEGALNKGSRERYGLSEKKPVVPQGVEGRVAYKGSLSKEVYQLSEGIRASFGFMGVKDIPACQKKAKFIRVTSAGKTESHPHNITITKEASNYRRN